MSSLPVSLTQELSGPVESLLISGGDSRLELDQCSTFNRYGCQPWPRPSALAFASSTATTISEQGFRAAAGMRRELLKCANTTGLEQACDRELEWLRDRLKCTLGVESGTEIVFSASGTDSAVHAVYIAQEVLGAPAVNVIVGVEETGSGIPQAIAGCHFDSCTSQGGVVERGERIPGFAKQAASIRIPVRANGEPRSHSVIDQHVLAVIHEASAAGKQVVLYAMDHSKLGWRGPSLACLREINARWGRTVQVVVDACQFRCSRARLRSYLEHGFIVLITGSKYLAGPPFSGALLVPRDVSTVMERVRIVPSGLALYSARNNWPVRWCGVRQALQARSNVGQLLRWAAAEEQLRAYFAVPASYRSLALRMFAGTVHGFIAERSNLQLVPVSQPLTDERIDDEEMGNPTIFPFVIRHCGKLLSAEACHLLYRALNCDVSQLLARSGSAEQRGIAAALCHVGQPVSVLNPVHGLAGALRISASARMVSETWCPTDEANSLRKLRQYVAQIPLVLDKLDLLLENFDSLQTLKTCSPL